MSDAHSTLPSDQDDELRPGVVAALGLVFIVILVGIILAMKSLFVQYAEEVLYKTNLSVPNPALAELRLSENERLTAYRVLDKSKGIYQIPIDRAMELVVLEAEKSSSTQSIERDTNAPEAPAAQTPGATTPQGSAATPEGSGNQLQ